MCVRTLIFAAHDAVFVRIYPGLSECAHESASACRDGEEAIR